MENEHPDLKRLHVFMASCGAGSRRKCEQLIAEGRVTVNGTLVTEQGMKISPDRDIVILDGKTLTESTTLYYLALNKPEGYICTNSDPQGRPLAIDLLGSLARKNRLFSVGRLDLMSSGLILYTNDGQFARTIAHPSAEVEKEYLIETRKPVPPEILDEFTRGIRVGGVHYRIIRYRIKAPTRLLVVLQEGKNRELRTMFAARRVQVRRIHRVRIGTVSLGSLPPGQFRYLSRAEVSALLGTPGARHRAPKGAHTPAPHHRKSTRGRG